MESKSILVTYASRRGSTGEIAEEIAAVLGETGDRVVVRPMSSVHNLIPFDSVVIGSAIYNGKPLPEAIDFLKTHEYALSKMPLVFFLVSNTLAQPNVELIEEASHFLDPAYTVAPHIHPLDVGLFAGSYEPARWNLFKRLADWFQQIPHGDFRNWKDIRHWASGIKPKISAAA
jgi:menaquinone-dependent protoporphyrinogen oxidase